MKAPIKGPWWHPPVCAAENPTVTTKSTNPTLDLKPQNQDGYNSRPTIFKMFNRLTIVETNKFKLRPNLSSPARRPENTRVEDPTLISNIEDWLRALCPQYFQIFELLGQSGNVKAVFHRSGEPFEDFLQRESPEGLLINRDYLILLKDIFENGYKYQISIKKGFQEFITRCYNCSIESLCDSYSLILQAGAVLTIDESPYLFLPILRNQDGMVSLSEL